MPSVSHSEVESYLLCRRKWYYGYGMSLQRINESASLALGSAGHKVLEAFYRHILAAGDTRTKQRAALASAYEVAWAECQAIYGDGYEDIDERRFTLEFVLFDPEVGYFHNEAMVSNGFLIKAVEEKYNLEYDPDTKASYPFVVDLIVEDPNRDIAVVDHKFVWDFYTANDTDIQPQIPKYIGALRALNLPAKLGYYNMIRTRKIKVPTREQSLRVEPIRPRPARIVSTFEEQIGVAQEVQRIKDLPIEEQSRISFRVSNKMVCQSCSFRSICEAEMNGDNTALVLRSEYKRRERKTFDAVSEDIV